MNQIPYGRLWLAFLVICIFLAVAPVAAGQGKGKPNKPLPPGNEDKTRFEVSLVEGDLTILPPGMNFLIGDLGTADIPNDCVSSFWVPFNSRAPLAWIDPPYILTGPDLEFETGDEIMVWVIPGEPYGVSFYMGKYYSDYVSSISIMLTSYPDYEGYYAPEIENYNPGWWHGCPTGNTNQSFEIEVNQVFEVWRKPPTGKRAKVGEIAIGKFVFEYDCDQDQSTENPAGGCPP